MMTEGIVRGRDGRVVIQYTQGGKGWLIIELSERFKWAEQAVDV